MKTVVITSRGEVLPPAITMQVGDVLPVVFDYSMLLGAITESSVETEISYTATEDGETVVVTLNPGSTVGSYDLTVSASDGTETKTATVQVLVFDRRETYEGDYGMVVI